MPSPGPLCVRFLLSNNLPGSLTRITADTASLFARWGVPSSVSYPCVNWWDYKRFILPHLSGPARWKTAGRLAVEILFQAPLRRRWCGSAHHPLHPDVQVERFSFGPSAAGWAERTVAVLHHSYLIPHLLRTLGSPGPRFVSAIHVDLEKAMGNPKPEISAWFTHWVALERTLALPRYATSEEARAAAERLGIPIQRLIHGGVDLRIFHPPEERPAGGQIVVSLYCDPNPQKGRAVGVEALRGIHSEFPEIELRSIGRVTPDQAAVFDRNPGYLNGDEYARALRESDILVYPSLYDGFPAPPLHAMASGAALVTTAVAGVNEYAVDGENALVCSPGDPAEIRHKVLRLVRDSALRRSLQVAGRKTAESFGNEHSARQLLGFLREVYEGTPTALEKAWAAEP